MVERAESCVCQLEKGGWRMETPNEVKGPEKIFKNFAK